MEHHRTAQFAIIVTMIFIAITISPAISLYTLFLLYVIGWFTNEKEIATLNAFLNKQLTKLDFKLTPKSTFNWGLINIGIQSVMGWILLGSTWGITVMIMYTVSFFLGIASTEENVNKLKQYRFYV